MINLQGTIMLLLIEQLRNRMPDIVITFTFPAEETYEGIPFPFRDVAK